MTVRQHGAGVAQPAEALPFPAARFDAVVATCVLCTVTDLSRALAEAYRVLKPGGQLIVLEHVRGAGRLARWQDRITPLWSRLAGGCHPNRDVQAAIGRAGFTTGHAEIFDPMPRWLPARPILQASAIRAPATRPGPVHVPAACTLDETGARDRIADWQRLARRAQLEASRQPGGAVELIYRDLPGVIGELRRLADAEARCCPFLTFTVTAEAGQPVTLRIAASPQADPGVAADLDQLASMFSQAG